MQKGFLEPYRCVREQDRVDEKRDTRQFFLGVVCKKALQRLRSVLPQKLREGPTLLCEDSSCHRHRLFLERRRFNARASCFPLLPTAPSRTGRRPDRTKRCRRPVWHTLKNQRFKTTTPEQIIVGSACAQDWAPGHIGDTDGQLVQDAKTDKTVEPGGFRKKRIDSLRNLNLYRSIIPRHGTPKLMQNDQIHQGIHSGIKREFKTMCGLHPNMMLRPRGEAKAKQLTKAGARKGVSKLQMVQALYNIASGVSAEKVMSTYVRTGYFSRGEGAALLGFLQQE